MPFSRRLEPRGSELMVQRYNASNNELLRTQTLVKSCIVAVDATPFRQWYESHVSYPLVYLPRQLTL